MKGALDPGPLPRAGRQSKRRPRRRELLKEAGQPNPRIRARTLSRAVASARPRLARHHDPRVHDPPPRPQPGGSGTADDRHLADGGMARRARLHLGGARPGSPPRPD